MKDLIWEVPQSATNPPPQGWERRHCDGQQLRPGRRRTSCVFCGSKKMRCFVPVGETACSSCTDRGVECSLAGPRDGQEEFEQQQWVEDGSVVGRDTQPFNVDNGFSPGPGNASTIAVSQPPWTRRPSPSVPRLLTPFDDLPPLPSEEIQCTLYLASFNETLALFPVISRSHLLHQTVEPLLALTIQAIAGRYVDRHAEATTILNYVARIILPAISGPSCSLADELWRFQMVNYFVVACFLHGNVAPGLLRLFSTAVEAARRVGLHAEVPGLAPATAEMRRRAWWSFVVVETHLAVALNVAPQITEEELGQSAVPESEINFESLGGPVIEDVQPLFSTVIRVFDDLANTELSSQPNPALPKILQPYACRHALTFVIRRRAIQLSKSLWSPTTSPPSPTNHALAHFSAGVKTWFRATQTFHEIGTGSIASAGAFKAGTYDWIHVTSAALVAFSPRWAIEQLFATPDDPGTLDAVRPVLTAWAASPHALTCAQALHRATLFWLSLLAFDPSATPDRGSAMQYDLLPQNLSVLEWDLVYAAKVLTGLQAFGFVGVGGGVEVGRVGRVLEDAAGRLAKTCAGLESKWRKVGEVRRVLGVGGSASDSNW
ncbi:hypothetical protein HDU96_002992 [Phlyctochytrium bullatum]|nr:hypothetical protein HDU96_002992 [Phlyctochytrium bullatum]